YAREQMAATAPACPLPAERSCGTEPSMTRTSCAPAAPPGSEGHDTAAGPAAAGCARTGADLRRVEIVVQENEVNRQQSVSVVIVVQANGGELVSRSVKDPGVPDFLIQRV